MLNKQNPPGIRREAGIGFDQQYQFEVEFMPAFYRVPQATVKLFLA